ncbi:translation initiation factor IF-2-like [Panicum virgatum]|uniref:translation initiation factor IF-2-like n=1 Tax=Panicum virgatum TaxID=38727 RepID=UPI0019D64296|nr:translation initiation factor IF-2-like [Panicum virgatum]
MSPGAGLRESCWRPRAQGAQPTDHSSTGGRRESSGGGAETGEEARRSGGRRGCGSGGGPDQTRPAGTRARQGGGFRTARGREPRRLAGRGGPLAGSLGWPARQGRSTGMRARPGAAAPRGGALGEPRTARARVRDPRSPGKHARHRGEGGGDSVPGGGREEAARAGSSALPPRSGSRWLEDEWGKFLVGPTGQ